MKKFLILLLTAALLMSLAGCNVLDYKKAMDHYKAGEYAQALELYRALGDYADSVAMAEICWQKADYQAAAEAVAAREYDRAISLYQGLGMYQDSPVKAIETQYQAGVVCVEAGEYAQGIAYFEELGSYRDCPEQIQQAKWRWLQEAVGLHRGQIRVKTATGMVRLQAETSGGFTIIYHNSGQILGMPYESNLTMPLNYGLRIVDYTADYLSTSTTTIEEKAAGTLDVGVFTGTEPLPVQTFSQTTTHPDGSVLYSTDPGDSLMMQMVLTEAAQALAQGLPQILEKSQVPITLKDLGFTALIQEEGL